jgi:hypothetical protein
VLYLALMKAKERWTMPIRDWPSALYHLSLVFPGAGAAVTLTAIYTVKLTLPTSAHANLLR